MAFYQQAGTTEAHPGIPMEIPSQIVFNESDRQAFSSFMVSLGTWVFL